jgi:hypothetical protein
MKWERGPEASSKKASAAPDLGGHPKPANGGHLKTGQ